MCHFLLFDNMFISYVLCYISSPCLQKQGTYNVQKQMLTESLGSGRHIPVKEGSINKKSSGGLRAEWKKKYLVLSEDELTYYPSLNVSQMPVPCCILQLYIYTIKNFDMHVQCRSTCIIHVFDMHIQ